MIDLGLEGKIALVTGGNNPYGIGAAIARSFASQGARAFIHYYRQNIDMPIDKIDNSKSTECGLPLFFEQQRKTADEVVKDIRENGGQADSWEYNLADPENISELFDRAEKLFGTVDILVNNAADYMADTFLPDIDLKDEEALWEGGPLKTTVNAETHDLHFAVNSRAVALSMGEFAKRLIKRNKSWGRIINISADCAWGCPGEISYRASKYALESYSRSAAAELGPLGITVNVVSPGPIQTGYIAPEEEKVLIPEIPLRRVGKPEDIADAVLFFASEQADWITGQLLFVHGGHRMALGR
ncbi:MAG: SDR family oxidoreductase [Deltaproteobacteria bacterium]|nr:MAG: SDR family oxidoreductase [Deltaproteobacteria bacterium]